MRRQRSPFIIIIPVIFIVVLLIFMLMPSETNQAKKVVNQFYKYEQKAEFGSSWELFHPEMKNKFSKSAYMQDRVHTFMGHFGAETFTFSKTRPKKIKNWKMTKESDPIEVYEIVVTKDYKGKYGHFTFAQYVYVSLDEEQPNILWDYKE
ncbi:hypothetical protein ACFFHM_01155 [Halalkalibacter kiskunsagensis]|uniref:DUF4829 domain-containing protein n=1 Tax=Halalkalibacter kiskunsagensis TaxID=1548599 RepID=A0ABV6K7A7_9BACI